MAGELLGAPGTLAAALRLVAGGAVARGGVDDTDLRAAAPAVSLGASDALRAFLDAPEVAALPYTLAERLAKIRGRVRGGMWL